MVIRYYKSDDLAYANRQRYRNISMYNFIEEEQFSILLGDGGNTIIKTSIDNLCNYVTIDDTRWYVTSYVYDNGGQVKLYLQRDVIGEFGIEGMFGKIERGYTETFLRNRKELDLNQRLVNRQKVYPNTNVYGQYSVDTHENEKWGILFLTKPSNSGTSHTIPIEAFRPSNFVDGLEYVNNGTVKTVRNRVIQTRVRFFVQILVNNYRNIISQNNDVCIFEIYFRWVNDGINSIGHYEYDLDNIEIISGNGAYTTILVGIDQVSGYERDSRVCSSIECNDFINMSFNEKINFCKKYGEEIGKLIINRFQNNEQQSSYELPQLEEINDTEESVNRYRNIVLLHENEYYRYNVEDSYTQYNYRSNYNIDSFYSQVLQYINNQNISISYNVNGSLKNIKINFVKEESNNPLFFAGGINYVEKRTFNAIKLTPEESGSLIIKTEYNLVDEPYLIYAMPLYNCNIFLNTDSSEIYSIDMKESFSVFNEIIKSLSGTNGFLVDAQIVPYAPDLGVISGTISNNNYPVFCVPKTSFERSAFLDIGVLEDVKKEYITKEYSIIAPDQSSKFTFNYYDYYTSKKNIELKIKIALKAFGTICSCVIIPDEDSLIGKTYESDLRGCNTKSTGFECSLSTNEYQQYARNNSNYKSFFDLEKLELQKQHSVERVNNNTALIVNTISAAASGAIGGAAIADSTFGNVFGSKAIGAIAGSVIAGGTVGAAMAIQNKQNEELMKFEEKLQQQRFDLTIGTIKNIPDQVTRVSSFNEIIMKDFAFIIETYECSDLEKELVNEFIEKYSYGLGIYGYYKNFYLSGWFIRGLLITSNLITILANIAQKELNGGIYYND